MLLTNGTGGDRGRTILLARTVGANWQGDSVLSQRLSAAAQQIRYAAGCANLRFLFR